MTKSVLVCFHAHPDDEVFTTGGVMRLAADAGHRVVLETSASALGVHRLEMLGYADSGMAGTPDNTRADAFCNVDVEVAASRLAAPPDVSEFGLPESEITTVVDVRAAMAAKRSAMAAHESQVGDFGPFLAMPAEQVEAAFGQESFRRRGGATDQRGTAALEKALPL